MLSDWDSFHPLVLEEAAALRRDAARAGNARISPPPFRYTKFTEAGQMSKMANSKDKVEQPNDPMYYVQFGYLLNRTGSLGAASMSDLLKEFDIPLPIWQILLILSEFGEQAISELASHTGIEMSYLSRTVLKAEKRGFIARAKSAKDKRVTYIKLVTGGRQMIRKVLPKTRLLRGIMFQGISDADIETTARTLKMVYDNLASNADAISEDINRKLTVARRTGKSSNRPENIRIPPIFSSYS